MEKTTGKPFHGSDFGGTGIRTAVSSNGVCHTHHKKEDDKVYWPKTNKYFDCGQLSHFPLDC